MLFGLAQWKGTATASGSSSSSSGSSGKRAPKRRKTKAGQDTGDEAAETKSKGKEAAAAAAPLDYDPAVTSQYLYFVYNNPDDVLLPFVRSKTVIEVAVRSLVVCAWILILRVPQNAGITKINLATGPQAVTGSTRMQVWPATAASGC